MKSEYFLNDLPKGDLELTRAIQQINFIKKEKLYSRKFNIP